MRLHKFKLFLFTLLITFFCVEQAQAIYFKHLGAEDGLDSPVVLSVYQDVYSRVWLGTHHGIAMFDGSKVTMYKPYRLGENPLYSGNEISQIVGDKDGNVFFMTNLALVRYVFSEERFETISKKSVSCIAMEGDTIWTAIDNKLYYWDAKLSKLVEAYELPFDNLTTLTVDEKGRHWIGTNTGAYYTDDYQHFHKVDEAGEGKIHDILALKNGEVWIGSESDGLVHVLIDGKRIHFTSKNSLSKGLMNDEIRDIVSDNSGRVWFGTFNGLYCYNSTTNSFTVQHREDRPGGLSHSSVYGLYIDSDNNLWAGTYYGGVNYGHIDGDVVKYYEASTSEFGLSHPLVSNMVQDKHGNLWVGTEGGGLNKINLSNGQIKCLRTNIPPYFRPGTNVKGLVYDREQDCLYISAYHENLFRYDILADKFTPIFDVTKTVNYPFKLINTVEKKGNQLYIATNLGVYVYNLKTKQTVLVKSFSHQFNTCFVDHVGDVWGTLGSLIYCAEAKNLGKITTYNTSIGGLSSSAIRVFEDSKDNIYAVSLSLGVLKLNRESNKFEPFFSTSKGGMNSYTYNIIETHSGNLVITGDAGVYIVTKTGQTLALYSRENGLPISSFTRDCGMYVNDNGAIYIGAYNGMISFNESIIKEANSFEKIRFSTFQIQGQRVVPNDKTGVLKKTLLETKKVVLEPTQNSFSILFSSSKMLSALNSSEYEYNIPEIDEKWYPIFNRKIQFANIAPGKYTICVRKYSVDSLVKMPISKLVVYVRPPWYASWWGILLLSAILIVVIIGTMFYVFKRQQLEHSLKLERNENERIKEMDEMKFQFFTSISHEFRTPLTLIISQIDLIIKESTLSPLIYKRLIKVMHQSQHLNKLVTELLSFRKYDKQQVTLQVSQVNINDMLQDLYGSFTELADIQNLHWELLLPDTTLNAWIDNTEFLKAINNVVINAFKYTPSGGQVTLKLEQNDEDFLHVLVLDTGIGIPEDKIDAIFHRYFKANNNTQQVNPIYGAGIGL
ncbi:MAG: two-component regulator propeller domain-containing protein, partial [Bacteroidaceae bacterium]